MGLIRIRLGKKDQLLKKWYKAMRDNGDNTSEAAVLIIRYYIRTGQYMDAACLKPDSENLQDSIKSAFVPEHSDVEDWLLKKADEGFKKATIVKRILRSSMRECTEKDTPFLLDTNKLFQMVEHPENMQNIGVKKEKSEKEPLSHKPEVGEQIKEQMKPSAASGIVKSIEPVTTVPKEDKMIDDTSSEPEKTIKQKPKQRSNTLFNNLVTTGLKH